MRTLSKIGIVIRTIMTCALVLSLTCNYLVYTGKISMTSQQAFDSGDYLTSLAASEPAPVVLKKGRK